MSLPDVTQESLNNTLRLYRNIQGLLQEGSFAGKFAPHLAECQQFIAMLIQELETKVEKEPVEDGKPKKSKRKKS